jgi:hypothetical protein
MQEGGGSCWQKGSDDNDRKVNKKARLARAMKMTMIASTSA